MMTLMVLIEIQGITKLIATDFKLVDVRAYKIQLGNDKKQPASLQQSRIISMWFSIPVSR